MNINECSKQIQQLSKANAHNNLPLDNYLSSRKLLLDELDQLVNGIVRKTPSLVDLSGTLQVPLPRDANVIETAQLLDKTEPYFTKKLDNCMNFIKGSTKSK